MAENTNVFQKDPNASLPYSVDWTNWLGSDTIAVSAWIVPAGITQVGASNTTKIATIILSGGTVGQTYSVTNRITTALGYIDDRSVQIEIAER